MKPKDKTPSQILNEAADFLKEEGRWGKGSFYRILNPTDSTDVACVMCAHGAISYCGDLKVKKIIDEGNLASPTASEYGLDSEEYAYEKAGNVGVAHYRANKVGLTYRFNDSLYATKPGVIAKLREAALLQ